MWPKVSLDPGVVACCLLAALKQRGEDVVRQLRGKPATKRALQLLLGPVPAQQIRADRGREVVIPDPVWDAAEEGTGGLVPGKEALLARCGATGWYREAARTVRRRLPCRRGGGQPIRAAARASCASSSGSCPYGSRSAEVA